jgi:hypothetical protein
MEGEIIRASEWTGKREGYINSRIVLRFRDGAYQPFVSHVDVEGKGLVSGDYSANPQKALANFHKRCRELRVEEDVSVREGLELDPIEREGVRLELEFCAVCGVAGACSEHKGDG